MDEKMDDTFVGILCCNRLLSLYRLSEWQRSYLSSLRYELAEQMELKPIPVLDNPISHQERSVLMSRFSALERSENDTI